MTATRGKPTDESKSPLTARQEQFLLLAAAGKSNAQIAAQFGITADTVNKTLRSAYARLKAKNRAEAVSVFGRMRRK